MSMKVLLYLFLLLSPIFLLAIGNKEQADEKNPISSIEVYASDAEILSGDTCLIQFSEQNAHHSLLLKKDKLYWLKITIDNSLLEEEENYLYFKNAFSEVALWQKSPGGYLVQKSIGGYNTPYIKCEEGRIIEDKLRFQASPGNETELLVSVYQPSNDVVFVDQASIMPKGMFDRSIRSIEDVQFMFAGIIFILCLYSLILFLYTHNVIYLLYFLYAFSTELYFLSFFNIIIISSNHVINQYSFFCTTISQVLYLWFIYFALKRDNYSKKMPLIKKYATITSIVVLLIIVFSIFGYKRGEMVSDLFTSVNGIIMFYSVFWLYKHVSNTIKIILIGLFTILLGVATSFILNLIKPLNWHMFFYQAGFFFELIFFTVAINYTYFAERNSRIKAMLDLAQLETEKLRTEKKVLVLKNEVDQKNRNLTSKAIELSKNNQALHQVIDKLTDLEEKETISKKDIVRMKNSLTSNFKRDNWKEFETYFTEVHPNFYNALNKKYPNLTPGEIKLCAFIKLNFSTKEIASITGKTPASIDVSRSRLRKKLNLGTSENLSSVISIV